ncbi:TrgA family protein [Thalassococcus sp. CAU 1522]|uniref:TrgA family protein n=1 Tax=Thalassococcus arenae TaxID=2851652 RepID=A0ABS6NAX4_9RHOB|nr:TrgA family protein [Thalassococcus arenae]MBV2361176.1 TrgA family protein [Thalassococcus arenae]
MPTAAKFIAALTFGILGLISAQIVKTLMPPSTDFGMFVPVTTGVAALCGWVIVGPRAGRGMSAAISNGFTGTVAMVLWNLFIQSANEMTARSFKRFYDTAFEAIAAIFEIAVEYGSKMLDPRLLMVLFLGGIAAGIITEFAARRWR